MSESTVPVLLPGLDGELVAASEALEEWAIALEHAAEDGAELGLDAVAVRGAIVVLWGTASRAATDPDGTALSSGRYGGPVGPEARLLAPDGRFEYEPIRTGVVDAGELAVLRGALEVCRGCLATGRPRDLADALDAAAERYHAAVNPYRGAEGADRAAPVRTLAAVLEVLTLDGPDADALREALADRQESGDVVLSEAADAARGRVAARIVRAWYGGDALTRWEMG